MYWLQQQNLYALVSLSSDDMIKLYGQAIKQAIWPINYTVELLDISHNSLAADSTNQLHLSYYPHTAYKQGMGNSLGCFATASF